MSGAFRALSVLLVSAVLAGCGSSGPTIPKQKLSKVVLQRNDLPRTLSAFFDGPLVSADVSPPRTDPSRFARLGGWIARYHRAGSTKTTGPLVVASRVDLFKDSGGAKKDFDLYRTQLRRSAEIGGKIKNVHGLGAEALALVQHQGTGPASVVGFTVVWREANATAELDATGFSARLFFAQVVALAGKQDRRLRGAAR
ncbi:MAG: hypothetical protein M3R70_12595 [Actinomycetota bacterium]|nr:hypothetical protein [Actinomycetota bacterium]